MKKLLYFAAALLVLAGCSNKEEVNGTQNEPANYGTITGQIDLPQGEDAKVGARKINAPEGWETATEAFTMQWESTDAIYIYNESGCQLLSNPSITDNIATFEGELLDNMSSYKVAYGYNPQGSATAFDVPYIADNYRPFADGTGAKNEFTIANFGPVIGLQLKGVEALTKIVVVLSENSNTLATYTMSFGESPLALNTTTATTVYFPIQYKETATKMTLSFYKEKNSEDVLMMSQSSTRMPEMNKVSVYPELMVIESYKGQLGQMENTTEDWED